MDSMERLLWSLRPPAPPAAPAPPPLPPVDLLVDRLLRRLSIGGTRERGTARLEIGAGPLQGAAILVHAEGARLRIELDTPEDEASRRWKRRLQERLEAQGWEAEILLG